MPLRRVNAMRPYRHRRYYKRRAPTRKWYRGRGQLIKNSRVHTLQPNKFITRLRFSFASGEGHTFSSTAGALVQYPYRANGPYDPYASAGGAQPRGFDNWMELYRRGVVLGSQCVAKFAFWDVASYAMKVGITMNDGSTVSNKDTAMEDSRTVSAYITPHNDRVTLVKRYSYKFFGSKDAQDNADLFFTSSADPTEQARFHIWGWALNGQTETCTFTGYIDYIIMLFDPITPAQS